MAMTRKDYRVIAEALFRSKPRDPETLKYQQWQDDMVSIRQYLAGAYYNFDAVRFTVWAQEGGPSE